MRTGLTIILINFFFNCAAQLSTSFNIGGLSLESSTASSFSGPLLFAGEKSCLQVSSGVIVFSSSALGSAFFNSDCSIPPTNTAALFTLAPNPAPGVTRLYFSGTNISAYQRISIFINDQNGKVVMQLSCMGSQLKNGYPLFLSHLAAGVYLVKVFCGDTASGEGVIYYPALKLINAHF